MSNTAKFNRVYANYGPQVREFERSTDVSVVVAEFMCLWTYPINALIGAKFTSQWLRKGEKGPNDPADLDLIFRMRETEINGEYYEIVLRNAQEVPFYGGWLVGGETIELTSEIVNDYRVLLVHRDGGAVRHEFTPGLGYVPVSGPATVAAMIVSRRRKMTPA